MKTLLVASLAGIFAVAAMAQTPTIEQSLNMKSVGSPRISPDGRYVAYTVSETNWEENAFESRIWMAMTAHRTARALPTNPGEEILERPALVAGFQTPRVSLGSRRQGADLRNLAGGRRSDRSSRISRSGVTAFEWSPDGKRIAFSSSGPESKSKKDRKGESTAISEVVEGDYTMGFTLWTLNVPLDASPATGEEKAKPETLTTGAQFSVGGFRWSPDSKSIAFSATRDPDLSSGDTSDIYVVRLSDKYVKKVVDAAGPDRNPIWSPDGTQIAYQSGREFSFLNSRIAIVGAEGGKPRVLAGPNGGELFDEDPQLIEWGAGGIYFGGARRTSSHLFRVEPI